MQDNELVERCIEACAFEPDNPLRLVAESIARAIIPIVRAEILQGLADAAASWGSKTAEEIATAIRNQEPTDG